MEIVAKQAFLFSKIAIQSRELSWIRSGQELAGRVTLKHRFRRQRMNGLKQDSVGTSLENRWKVLWCLNLSRHNRPQWNFIYHQVNACSFLCLETKKRTKRKFKEKSNAPHLFPLLTHKFPNLRLPLSQIELFSLYMLSHLTLVSFLLWCRLDLSILQALYFSLAGYCNVRSAGRRKMRRWKTLFKKLPHNPLWQILLSTPLGILPSDRLPGRCRYGLFRVTNNRIILRLNEKTKFPPAFSL